MVKQTAAVRIKRAAAIRNQRRLRFSLFYLQLNHPNFVLHECDHAFFLALFQEIARYQEFTVDEFLEPCAAEHRHAIFFDHSNVPGGFPHIDPAYDPELWTDTPWQFAVRGQQVGESTWRVHGFIDNVTFYIVWLDPRHQLFIRPQ
jgi:hypothetical protein